MRSPPGGRAEGLKLGGADQGRVVDEAEKCRFHQLTRRDRALLPGFAMSVFVSSLRIRTRDPNLDLTWGSLVGGHTRREIEILEGVLLCMGG